MNTELQIPYSIDGILSELGDTHNKRQVSDREDPSLNFSILIPKSWSMRFPKVKSPLALAEPTLIGSAHDFKQKTFVDIYATFLPFQVNLQDWTHFSLEQEGWEILESKLVDSPEGRVVDIIATRGDKALRCFALAHDEKIYFTNATTLRSEWNVQSESILVACSSFQIFDAPKYTELESELSYENDLYSCQYPATWTLALGKSTNFNLVHEGAQLATLRLSFQENSDSSTDELMKSAHTAMVGMGIFPKEIDENAKESSTITIPGFRRLDIVHGLQGELPIETRIGIKNMGDQIAALTLVGPQFDDNPFIWMRAKAAFEKILQSLKESK